MGTQSLPLSAVALSIIVQSASSPLPCVTQHALTQDTPWTDSDRKSCRQLNSVKGVGPKVVPWTTAGTHHAGAGARTGSSPGLQEDGLWLYNMLGNTSTMAGVLGSQNWTPAEGECHT